MYAVMMARSFTKRESVVKIGGGWHGSQPFVLKGISTYRDGLREIESAGLPAALDAQTIVTRFNDIEDLEETFKKEGDRIAGLIVEPFIGSGGFIFAEREYLRKARELTERHGAVLIFDEVVSGFRFHAGAVQTLFGVSPDLSAFGKVIGGGMPVSAVAGKREILALCDPKTDFDARVKFEGGTYSAHPASMLAGKVFLQHLIEHEKEIYPTIGRHGNRLRWEIEETFTKHGFHVRCSGGSDVATEGSSIVGVHFVDESVDRITCPDQVWNPETGDPELRESVFKLAMLVEGINTFHGFGAVSTAHTEDDIQSTLDAVERVAEKWKAYKR
jgi:glutamate-1-semialdehyde 2,1-aminomutase